MSWHCSLPFSHIYTDPSGHYGLCCMSKLFNKSIHDTTLQEYFYSKEMKSIREEFETGKLDKVKSLCQVCIEQEKNGDDLYRQLWSEEVDQLKDGDRHMTFKLSIFGNYCNLSCYMCFPVNSSRREADLKKIGWYEEFNPEKSKASDIDEVFDQLKPFLSKTTAFVIIGGEPLLMDKHYRFLDLLIKSGESKNISLSYTSNLTLNVDKFESYVKHFKNVRVSVSIDGVGEKNDYIRYGSKFDTIVENMKKLSCIVQVYYTVSILSVFDCNKAYDYFDYIADYNIVYSPDFLSIKHLPQDIKNKLLDQIKFSKVQSELKKERSEDQWQKAIKYIKKLDESRERKSYELFPEIAHVLR